MRPAAEEDLATTEDVLLREGMSMERKAMHAYLRGRLKKRRTTEDLGDIWRGYDQALGDVLRWVLAREKRRRAKGRPG